MSPCPPISTVPWYIVLLPVGLLALWIWDGYLWRHHRLCFDQYLWHMLARFLGTDRR